MFNNSQTLRENGGFRALGWARLTTFFMEKNVTVKIFGDVAQFGRANAHTEGFVFTQNNTSPDILKLISRQLFSIKRYFNNCSWRNNCHPPFLEVKTKDGLYINNQFFPNGSIRILMNGDYIKLRLDIILFQFLDDRDLNLASIPNRILRKFYVDDFIGKGGQSTVRMIHELETGTKYALKIISKCHYDSEDPQTYEKRIQHMSSELKAMRELKDNNVIKFVETCSTRLDLFIVMEFAETDLLKICKGNELSESDFKFFFYQIVKGLRYIHSANIAHRDIKLENILVTYVDVLGFKECVMKIADFGYSKNVSEGLVTQLGTPVFCPPEIVEAIGEYTTKADIWTLGCLLYALITREFPFHQDYGTPLCQQILRGEIFWGAPVWETVSKDAKSLIHGMIQVDPEMRPSAEMILNCAEWFNDENLNKRCYRLYNFLESRSSNN